MLDHAATSKPGSLEHRILASLHHYAAESVAELSAHIGSPRPSVSRLLANLTSAGYVDRDARRLQITDLGRRRLQRTIEEVPTSLDKNIDEARRLAEQQKRLAATMAPFGRALSVLPDTTGALGPWEAIYRQTAIASEHLSALLAPLSQPMFNEVAEGLGSKFRDLSIGTDWARTIVEATRLPAIDRTAFGAAFQASLSLQRFQLDWLDTHKSFAQDISRIVSDNLVASSWLSSDLAALADLKIPDAMTHSGIKRALESATSVATAQQSLVRRSLHQLAEPGTLAPAQLATFGVSVPTAASAGFVRGLRSGLSPEQSRVPVEPTAPHAPPAGSVGEILESLNPRLATLWRGTWYDLQGGSPNSARDVSHGARELLRQVLEALAPDSAVQVHPVLDTTSKITRSMRIKWIVGGTSETGADWAERLARALDGTYSLLAAEAHTDFATPRFAPEAIAGILESLGGLIRFLVHCRSDRSQDD